MKVGPEPTRIPTLETPRVSTEVPLSNAVEMALWVVSACCCGQLSAYSHSWQKCLFPALCPAFGILRSKGVREKRSTLLLGRISSQWCLSLVIKDHGRVSCDIQEASIRTKPVTVFKGTLVCISYIFIKYCNSGGWGM